MLQSEGRRKKLDKLPIQEAAEASSEKSRVRDFVVGEEVPVDSFTDYSTLGELIDRFNATFPDHSIDKQAVLTLRDSIAHGRVLRAHDGISLVKFSRPQNETVRVEVAEMLDDEWFATKDALIQASFANVDAALVASAQQLINKPIRST